jgi:hypothetical protein
MKPKITNAPIPLSTANASTPTATFSTPGEPTEFSTVHSPPPIPPTSVPAAVPMIIGQPRLFRWLRRVTGAKSVAAGRPAIAAAESSSPVRGLRRPPSSRRRVPIALPATWAMTDRTSITTPARASGSSHRLSAKIAAQPVMTHSNVRNPNCGGGRADCGSRSSDCGVVMAGAC